MRRDRSRKQLCYGGVRTCISCAVFASLLFVPACKRPADGAGAQPGPPQALQSTRYTLGETIKFGAGGGSERFRLRGWSQTEAAFTWSVGASASLVFSIEPQSQPLLLRARLGGRPPVEVFANDEKIAQWEVSSPAEFTATIPAHLVAEGGALIIELKTPNAASPKSLGAGEDVRELGIQCSEVAITKL